MLFLLLGASVAAQITLRDTITLGKAKLYQAGMQGYSLELVAIDPESGQARFFVNQEELTDPFNDEYTTRDNSTIQILEIGHDNQSGIPLVELYFDGSGIDPLRFEEGKGYRVRHVISAFDYTQLYTREEILAMGLPTEQTDMKYVTMESEETRDATTHPTRVRTQVRKADLEAKKSTFDFGWLVDLWTWIKRVFT